MNTLKKLFELSKAGQERGNIFLHLRNLSLYRSSGLEVFLKILQNS